MKPATSLCRWREVAGTRRCTTSSPASATRQVPPTTSTPKTMVSSREDLPFVDLTPQYSSCYATIRGKQARLRQEVRPGTPPTCQLARGLSRTPARRTSEDSLTMQYGAYCCQQQAQVQEGGSMPTRDKR